MPHYLRLCRFTEKGLKHTDKPAKLFAGIRKTLDESECKLEAAFMTIGAYDFVSIIHATNDEAMKAANQKLDTMGLYTAKTMAAFPADKFVEWAEGDFSPFLGVLDETAD